MTNFDKQVISFLWYAWVVGPFEKDLIFLESEIPLSHCIRKDYLRVVNNVCSITRIGKDYVWNAS